MKMLVFYRSREYTNAIISSAKAKLAQNKLVAGLDVDFVNLDKRNYIKVLQQMDELPRFVYIWYDEEKVSDYINETYPAIKVIHFSQDNAVDKAYNSWGGYIEKQYKLADMMIAAFKENLEKKELFVVDKYKKYKITKEELDDLDVANKKTRSGIEVFQNREEAKVYVKQSLEHDVSVLESDIEERTKMLNSKKKELTSKKNQLKKFEK